MKNKHWIKLLALYGILLSAIILLGIIRSLPNYSTEHPNQDTLSDIHTKDNKNITDDKNEKSSLEMMKKPELATHITPEPTKREKEQLMTHQVQVIGSISFKNHILSGQITKQDTQGLLAREFRRGPVTLHHPDNPAFKNVYTCNDLRTLEEKGWYAHPTFMITREIWTVRFCNMIKTLQQAHGYEFSYFNLDPEDWWKALPTDVIPPTSGIDSTDSWKRKLRNLQQLRAEAQTLEELNRPLTKNKFPSAEDTHTITIVMSEWECSGTKGPGTTTNELTIYPEVLGDFDGDQIAELVIFTGRATIPTDKCWLGTGNYIGYGDWMLLDKDSPDMPITSSEIDDWIKP